MFTAAPALYSDLSDRAYNGMALNSYPVDSACMPSTSYPVMARPYELGMPSAGAYPVGDPLSVTSPATDWAYPAAAPPYPFAASPWDGSASYPTMTSGTALGKLGQYSPSRPPIPYQDQSYMSTTPSGYGAGLSPLPGTAAGDLRASIENQYNLDRQIYKYEDTVGRPQEVLSADPPMGQEADEDEDVMNTMPGYKSPYSGRRLKAPIIPDPRIANPKAYIAHLSTFWRESSSGHPVTSKKREKRLGTVLAMYDDMQTYASRQTAARGGFVSSLLGSLGNFFQMMLSPANPPSSSPPLLPPGPVKDWTPISGKRKALLIGINYTGQKGQLRGCANDAREMEAFLQRRGFTELQKLIDDGTNSTMPPTRSNILNAIQWLISGAAAGDSLFFHYSGHGGQQRDTSGDEWDGKDETIVPVDFQSAGMIVDDTLSERLCLPLPANCRLTAVMDCCHSGTGLDLPYVKPSNSSGLQSEYKDNRLKADIVLLSGCRDDQTSADVMQGDKGFGALTNSFLNVLRQNSNQTYNQLMEAMRQQMQAQRHTQVPQISMSRNLNLDAIFTV